MGSDKGEKDDFWGLVGNVMTKIPLSEVMWIGADFNGHIEEGYSVSPEIMGNYGVGVRSEEGKKIVEFATANKLAITNTYFWKRMSKRTTQTGKGLDTKGHYILCRKKELQKVQPKCC